MKIAVLLHAQQVVLLDMEVLFGLMDLPPANSIVLISQLMASVNQEAQVVPVAVKCCQG